ncbi:MAG: leucine--tRNA ligase [Gemmatimonadota bacterium]|nr:leucine--tRNA ligase [Gemmatimonadota bacterium]
MTLPHTRTPADEPASYDPAAIERKWQARWEADRSNSPDMDAAPRPFYQLMMFPYPSAEGLHIGNVFAFTGNDIYGRLQRLRGHTVFEPIGFDAFGIHSENHALKVGINPAELIPRNIENFRRQLRRVGLMVDWSREVDTTDPRYYKWTQWIFLQLLERGLAYKKKAAVNWCPFDKTVLANEQVIDGACERCKTKVEQRFLEQWFFRISEYAGRLLENLDRIDWSESTKTAQRNWIGKSEGAQITFRVVAPGGTEVPVSVFTTRPDTIFGATYLVLAPEHPAVEQITTADRVTDVRAYQERAAGQDLVARKVAEKDKTGVFTGAWAHNPATGEPIPVWVADYVLMEYGTGAIMAVPGHDARDFEFATTFHLPIRRVVAGAGEDARTPLASVHEGEGTLVNSAHFDGMSVKDGKRAITEWLASSGRAAPVVNYRLHDWCISRQRYWGPPIPVIYCDGCGIQQVPLADLPVLLPQLDDFRPDDSGVSPLARHTEWYRVPCPECGKMARRETDVSDTFLDSAWYFLRYPSSEFDDRAFDQGRTRRWLPVNSYIGGNEHAVLHLLYTRFITMVLHDMGHLDFEEPFRKFRAHGMIIRDGAKMSKSRGNVVNPDEYIERWGADAFRSYLMFLGPFEEGGDFRDQSISGVRRFLDRLWVSAQEMSARGSPDPAVMRKLHQTIRKVGDDGERLSFNTAIAAMMEYMNVLRANERTPHRAEVEPLVQLVAPFAPHIAEELWEQMGHDRAGGGGGGGGGIFAAGWPSYDPALVVEESVEIVVQVNGKLRGRIAGSRDMTAEQARELALSDDSIARFVSGAPRKVIYVPGRLLNIVV